MSTFEFKLPDIGEGVAEGEVVKWLVAPGDEVAEDQPVVEVMTDKATVTITSPKAGRVRSLGGEEGKIIAVHAVLLVLELADGEPARAAAAPGAAATAVGDIREELPGVALVDQATAAVAAVAGYFEAKPLATPATRKLARELGVDLTTVRPTGANGRVLERDVQGAVASPGGTAAVASRVAASPMVETAREPAASIATETRVPLRGMRRRIFQAMARSKHTAAHFTFVEECQVDALAALRQRLKPTAAEQGVSLSYLPFIVKAVVAALRVHPALNCSFDEERQEIVEHHRYDVGIATATDAGLMVPVVRGADRLTLLDLGREIVRLAQAARDGTARPDELRGSTFTITSLGRQGGLFATPILNPPEVGILGVHQIKDKPVVREGRVGIGRVMLLSLSVDHRLIDGHVGAAFAHEVIALLEDPDRLWLTMA